LNPIPFSFDLASIDFSTESEAAFFSQMTPFEPVSSDRSKVKRKEPEEILTKDRLLEIIMGLLETDADLGFLLKVDQTELKTLVACIRDRVDRVGK
jgi:hypothetical protein